MNIFYLHSNPKLCAQYHVNRHVTKMIIEYSQILSTSHRVLDGIPAKGVGKKRPKKLLILPDEDYQIDDQTGLVVDHVPVCHRQTHVNHPSSIWARKCDANYLWLVELLECVHAEWIYRYDHPANKIHKAYRFHSFLKNPPKNIPKGRFTAPTPAMDDVYKIGDSLSSYRNYYVHGKAHLAKWKKRDIPAWYKAAC